MGFPTVAMLAVFFFSSPDMKAHAMRKFPFLKRILQENSNQPESEGAGNVVSRPPAAGGNEMELNVLARSSAGLLPDVSE